MPNPPITDRLSDQPSENMRQKIADADLIQLIDKSLAGLGIGPIGGGSLPSQPAQPSAPKVLDSIIPGTVNINFDGPPVGGWSSLSMWPDGKVQFSGHLHDSGAPDYDYNVVWVVADSAGTAFLFTRSGHLHGLAAGSRDDDWSESQPDYPTIKDAWPELSAGYSWRCSASVNTDLGPLVDAVTKAVGTAGKVITVIASVG